MSDKIKILHLEDNDFDAELLQSQLKITGINCDIVRVSRKSDFVHAVENMKFDMILSDNSLPDFDGIDALRYAKKNQPETPFIFLSGTIGEDIAIEAMRWGATDYVLKQKIEKLSITIKRVIEESQRQKELEEANKKIKENEERLKIAQEVAHLGTWELNIATKEVHWSDEQYKIFGFAPNQVQPSHMLFINTLHPDDKLAVIQELDDIFKGIKKEFARELRVVRPDGTIRIIQSVGRIYSDKFGKPFKVVGTVLDITEQRQAAEVIRRNEERLRIGLSTVNIAVFNQDKKLRYTWMYQPQLQYAPEQVVGKTDHDLLPFDTAEKVTQIKRRVLANKRTERAEIEVKWKGKTFFFDLVVEPLLDSNGNTIGITGASLDITERKKMLDVLAESEEKFRTLFENAVVGFYRTTPSGEIIMANPALCRMLNYSSFEELQQRNLNDEGFEPLYPRSTFIQEIESKGSIAGRESVWAKKTGERIYVRESAKVIKDDTGKALYYEGTVENITERKKMEEERERLTAILEATPDFVGILDSKSRVIYLNSAGKKMLGLNPNQNISELNFAESHPAWAKKIVLEVGLPTAIREGTWLGETALLNAKTGNETLVSQLIIVHKNSHGKVEYLSTVARDITDWKKMEEELIVAKEKAEEMDRLKSCFLSNMSHELRTPMIAIMGYSEILQKEISNTEHLAMIEGILDGATRLNTTLDSILELSKMEAGTVKLTFSEQNLVEEVEKKVNSLKPLANQKNLFLDFSASGKNIYAEINTDLLGNALTQLISNGIKFTKQGGISVHVSTKHEQNKHYATIKVIDTGIGISSSQHKKIFGEFVQASQGYDRHFEGSGIGLTIAAKSVQLMKGEITLDSQPGKGSVFEITLPLKMNETQLRQELKERKRTTTIELAPSTSHLMPSILMVEDNASNRQIIKLYLQSSYDITEAADGITALALASKKQFDLVLMDINLGESIDGIETMKRLRLVKGYNDIPVLAVTAYVMPGDRERFLNSGFEGYVPKPFTKEILVDAVKTKLKVRLQESFKN